LNLDRHDTDQLISACDNEEEMNPKNRSSNDEEKSGVEEPELWDMSRPLVGNCSLEILKFDSEEGKTVFWHSSSHLLGFYFHFRSFFFRRNFFFVGASLERNFGAKLTVGPPLDSGFYYDCYMGNEVILSNHYPDIESNFNGMIRGNFPFQRLVLSKEQALDMFIENPFKVSLITNKVPDGGNTTVYKVGNFIDLCMGPHIPSTNIIKAFQIVKNSGSYWLGNDKNDVLQRVYGISFPNKKDMKEYKKFQEMAKERDHRKIGLF